MDQLTLKRTITEEYAPRLYQMTGDTFEAMKAAVKARPGARFDGTLKAWAIKGDDIKALKEQGYAIEQEEDFRLQNWQAEGIFDVTIRFFFELRERDGTWRDLPLAMKRQVKFSDEEVEAKRAELAPVHGEVTHGVALANLTRTYVQKATAEMKATFAQALNGKRDMDAIKRGLLAIQEAVKRG